MRTHKLEIKRPKAMMLCDGESLEGAVEGVSGLRDFALVHQKLAVVQPNSRHLHKARHTRSNRKYPQRTKLNRKVQRSFPFVVIPMGSYLN